MKGTLMPSDKVFSRVLFLAEATGKWALAGVNSFMPGTMFTPLEYPGTVAALVDATRATGLGETKGMLVRTCSAGNDEVFHGCCGVANKA